MRKSKQHKSQQNKTRKPCCRRESARCRCNFRSI